MIEFTTSVDAIHRGSGIYKDGVYVGGRYENRVTVPRSKVWEGLERIFPYLKIEDAYGPLTIRCTGDQFAEFLIWRNGLGVINEFKSLNAKIVEDNVDPYKSMFPIEEREGWSCDGMLVEGMKHFKAALQASARLPYVQEELDRYKKIADDRGNEIGKLHSRVDRFKTEIDHLTSRLSASHEMVERQKKALDIYKTVTGYPAELIRGKRSYKNMENDMNAMSKMICDLEERNKNQGNTIGEFMRNKSEMTSRLKAVAYALGLDFDADLPAAINYLKGMVATAQQVKDGFYEDIVKQIRDILKVPQGYCVLHHSRELMKKLEDEASTGNALRTHLDEIRKALNTPDAYSVLTYAYEVRNELQALRLRESDAKKLAARAQDEKNIVQGILDATRTALETPKDDSIIEHAKDVRRICAEQAEVIKKLIDELAKIKRIEKTVQFGVAYGMSAKRAADRVVNADYSAVERRILAQLNVPDDFMRGEQKVMYDGQVIDPDKITMDGEDAVMVSVSDWNKLVSERDALRISESDLRKRVATLKQRVINADLSHEE